VGFEVIDISGDVGIRAFGSTFEEALMGAGIGFYSLITDVSSVAGRLTREVAVEAETREELTVRFLNELVFLFDTYGLIGKKIDVLRSVGGPGSISAAFRVSGETFDPARHEQGLLVKAATYHNLTCEEVDGTWLLEIMFDI
jgi:SHS2 domain-containing protein